MINKLKILLQKKMRKKKNKKLMGYRDKEEEGGREREREKYEPRKESNEFLEFQLCYSAARKVRTKLSLRPKFARMFREFHYKSVAKEWMLLLNGCFF